MNNRERMSSNGRPPNLELANNILSDRKCRDSLCLFIYIVATIIFIFITHRGFTLGKPERVYYAYDSDGQACGHDAKVINAPYIYLIAPLKGYLNRSVCVTTCPNWQETQDPPTHVDCIPTPQIPSCSQFYSLDGRTDLHNITSDILITQDYANEKHSSRLFNYSTFIYNTTAIYHMICIPSGLKYAEKIYSNMDDFTSFSTLTLWLSDLELTFKIIVLTVSIGLVLSILTLFFVSFKARFCYAICFILIFCSMIIFLEVFADIGEHYFHKAHMYDKKDISKIDGHDYPIGWIYCGYEIGIWAIFFSYIMILINYYLDQLDMFCYTIESIIQFIKENLSIIIFTSFFIIIIVAFWIFWIMSFFHIYSMGEIKMVHNTPFDTIEWDKNISIYLFYHLFFGLWTGYLFHAYYQFFISSVCCLWLYKNQYHNLKVNASLQSVILSITHFGSLIFGAFLLMSVELLFFWLQYLSKMIKKESFQNTAFSRYTEKYLRCFLQLYDALLSFIDTQAFIQIALTGDNFITSGRNACYLFTQETGIGNIYCSLCNVTVALTSTCIGHLIMTYNHDFLYKLNSPLLPGLCLFIFSYMISGIVFSIYSIPTEAILQSAQIELKIFKENPELIRQRKIPQPIQNMYKDYLGVDIYLIG